MIKKRPYSIPIAKRPKHKSGSNFRAIRRKASPQEHGFSDLTGSLAELDHARLGKRYNFEFIIKARMESAFVECLALAANSDDLAALIKSNALSEVDSAVIITFCQAKALERDRIVSLAVTRIPKWDIRRKARNIRRRLLRAILYREAGMSLQSTKGAKYNLLVNLAKNKNLI